VLGCRYLGDDVIEGGNHVDDAAWFGVEFARAGLDFLSISKGGKFEDAKQPKVGWAAYPYTGQSGYECMPTIYSDARGPFARNTPIAGAIRASVRAAGFTTPVIAAGGICEFAQAEAVLERGEADLVASARQSLADPDWFVKMREGRGAEIRRCEFTNYCEALDQQHKQVTCKLWDRDELDEPDVTLASDGKRRLVAPRWRR
jgi:2,4-dienoyl-CoA reductase-like NADH-dependent reductase (Old Yellow Enzyme family)